MASKSLSKPTQKLIYSKDSNISLSSMNKDDSNIIGLFKSSSSLSRSIRHAKPGLDQSSSLKSSGAMIINSNNSINSLNDTQATSLLNLKSSTFKTPPASVQKDIQIRNIIHNYSNIDCNDNTYKILNTIKSDKRQRNLDTLDEYEVWKTDYLLSTEDKVKAKILQLRTHLNETQAEINSKFTMKDNELIPLIQRDIDDIARFYHSIIQSRDNSIEETLKNVMEMYSQCNVEIIIRIQMLSKHLDSIGFLLEEENADLTKEKNTFLNNVITNKKSLYTRVINEIRVNEKRIVDESAEGLVEFILRWKNVKLNHYVSEAKKLFNSEEYVDNKERYELIERLKEDQMMIYNLRKALVFERLFKLEYDDINAKNIEKFNKELEDIYASAEKTFTKHVEVLVANSDDIQMKTMNSIEEFKEDVGTISYEFGKDNLNEQRYNNYDEINDLNGLIEMELTPIVSNNKFNRTDYISRINAYIDEYEEYVHNVSSKLIMFYAAIGKLYDNQKSNVITEDKKYLFLIAKATDDDEDVIIQKEDCLKVIIEKMRTCINKTELDEGLESSFKIMDELEVEYRGFFKEIEELLNSHEGLITDLFHRYEEKILVLFGIYGQGLLEAIQNRRNKESAFLSKKKEAETAMEEERKYEEEMKNQQVQGGDKKKKPPPKKAEKKPVQLKKGELPPALVPVREINPFKSLLDFEYLIDYTTEEYTRHILRNIVNNRDDDIFELKPKPEPTPEELQKMLELQQQEEAAAAALAAGKKPVAQPKKGTTTPLPSTPNETNMEFYNAFDPYNGTCVKVLISPLSQKQNKLLSETNDFNEEQITLGLQSLCKQLTETLVNNHKAKVQEAQLHDNERREELLSELDIRLKSLAPRKGKIEVEEYDKRLGELEKHDQKLNQHKEILSKRNTKDNDENNSLLSKLDTNFTELQVEYDKLSKGIEEEETYKGLEDKYKKFKTTYYDFLTDLSEIEGKLEQYSKTNPEALLQLNKNYMLSLVPLSKGGTYSDREIANTQELLDEIDNDLIKNDQEERIKKNSEKLSELKKNSENFMNEIDKKYSLANENIMAKEAIGKKFGAPKRLANDIIINIKIKCNQAQESLSELFTQLNSMVCSFNSLSNNEALKQELKRNVLPLEIRRQISKINTCVFYYGKYVDAFKPNTLASYALARVLMKENIETCEIVAKEDIDEDERLKNEEIKSLGFLGKIILEGNPQQSAQKGKGGNASGGNEPSYNYDVGSIDDKVKSECAKLYVGPYAKFITTNDKLPASLVPFLQNIKNEMEFMRLKCIRDLRTYCQNLYKFSLEIPQCIYKFIYSHSTQNLTEFTNNLTKVFNTESSKSSTIKADLKAIIGPYLANPYYQSDLSEIEGKENTRSSSYITCLNNTQFSLIENEERSSNDLTIRMINNFESLLTLFDNFIFEEEFISLGDEEYFKQRQTYNELLKLKVGITEMANNASAGGKNVKPQTMDASNYNLDSKRTFKKIYKGINKNQGKINYYQRFKESIVNHVQNSEEKIKMLETEYGKENYTRSVNGIKLQNNKNLYLERNQYYNVHCSDFNKHIDAFIKVYNDARYEELEYKDRWNEMLKGLKLALEGNIHN